MSLWVLLEIRPTHTSVLAVYDYQNQARKVLRDLLEDREALTTKEHSAPIDLLAAQVYYRLVEAPRVRTGLATTVEQGTP